MRLILGRSWRIWGVPSLAVVALLSCLFVLSLDLPLRGRSPAASQASELAAGPPLKILLVGNSMSRGVRRQLEHMLEEAGYDARVGAIAPGIWTLTHHARAGTTRRRIEREDWDFVLLQERSTGINEGPSYTAARQLNGVIRATGARTVFFMTWRERGMPPYTYDALRGNPGGTAGYVPIAWELHAPIAPVGWAIRTAVAQGAAIDFWKGNRGRHLGEPGRYLGACVVYAALLRRSPVGLSAPRRLDPFVASYLQDLATRVVLNNQSSWNLN